MKYNLKIHSLVGIIMKKLFLCLIIFCSLSVLAQDKIYLSNGQIILAKILKVTEENIEYKKYSNLEDSTFVTSIDKIQLIVYQNGESQTFLENSIKNGRLAFTNKSRINIDLIGYGLNAPTSISYEILNKKANMGIEIPFSVFYNSSGINGFMTGTNLKYYTSTNARGFYIGPALGVGLIKYYVYQYAHVTSNYYFGAYLGPTLGGQFQISNLFGINLNATGGLLSTFTYFDPTFFYSLTLGINFSF